MDAHHLKAIGVFAPLSERDQQMVAAWASITSAAEGEVLMREDDFSYDVLGILDGTVAVSSRGRLIAELGAGELVGEIGVLARGLRTATVTATAPVLAVRLTRWDLRHLELEAPAAVAAIRGVAEDRRALAA